MLNTRLRRTVTLAAALTLALTACGGDDGEDPSAEETDGETTDETFTIGVSNTLVGNDWREQMVCSIQAQALESGVIDEVVLANRDTDASGQISDIEGLISQGVDAIIVNPADPTALDDVIAAADQAGILVISVDQAVTAEEAYNVTNDQTQYAEIGARWLFEQMGGEGAVLYMRGADGAPADTARDEGFQAALADYPDINVAEETFTGWDPSTGAQQALDVLSSQQIDGIWTSGIDYTVVEQFNASGHDYVPIVGADNNGFIAQLLELQEDDLVGTTVSNPPAVGGVATAIAVDLLTGSAEHDQNTLLEPVAYNNVDDTATLEDLYEEDLPDGFSATMEIEPYTTYTREDVIACEGPGSE